MTPTVDIGIIPEAKANPIKSVNVFINKTVNKLTKQKDVYNANSYLVWDFANVYLLSLS